ncbi:hypothetical protein DFH08DRAFT_1081059 [Mycena albidolilacea]|uniref:Uncharacterized protein n=1 Tax=Mycena albidolilacea TaxID=1033008 RepID=A0AAD7ERJ9_9AGAR|nr:hypothetical protein DFH08DRAFT_1081059 [Mycena albidolilacea]
MCKLQHSRHHCAPRPPSLDSGMHYTGNRAHRPVISTVAPDELSEILDGDDFDKSRLGREVIEYQLECYEEYISAPPRIAARARIPSLVDLAAEKIPAAADASDAIPDEVLSHHIWGWHSIPYAMFRAALTRLSEPGEPASKRQKTDAAALKSEGDIDEWILFHEKYLGDNERLGNDWRQHPLITLQDADCDAVFPTSIKTSQARTITRRPDFLGYKVLDGARSLTVDIQPSVAAFRAVFDRMTDGLLKNLNWNNVIVAGGIVLGVLLSVTGAGEAWKASDLDIYLYGLTPAQANDKLRELFATFKANLPPGSPVLIVRNSKTVTFYSKYPLRRIQVVLKLGGSEFWMLPRAARALETGFDVFTMNMIQGHYLSERRATQEQRVFKYAGRGYGLRILPSYISSLSESAAKLDDICREETLFGVNMDKIAAASRRWTREIVEEISGGGPKPTVSHAHLENKHQLSAEPQNRSCLTGFGLFMRHVALWEMERGGEIEIKKDDWASTNYGDAPESVLTYDDTPSYTWGKDFNIPDFKHQIDSFNVRQITEWLPDPYWNGDSESFREEHGLEDEDDEEVFKHAARLTHATSIDKILDRRHDIVLPVVVPRNLAAYINRLVGAAQQAAGLHVQHLLTPAVKDAKHLVVPPSSADSRDGLYMWRIGKEIMWQQLDRRIDEVFEVLYSFYRAYDRIQSESKDVRLVSQLSKRAIRATVKDEFDTFARWIGRQPLFAYHDIPPHNNADGTGGLDASIRFDKEQARPERLVLVELATAALETAAARLSAWARSLRHRSASGGATSMQGLEGDYENRDWDVNNDVPMAQKAHHQQPMTDLRQVYLEAEKFDDVLRTIIVETDIPPPTQPVSANAAYSLWSIVSSDAFGQYSIGAEIDGVKISLNNVLGLFSLSESLRSDPR